MTPRTHALESDTLRAIVTANGRAKCNLFLYAKADPSHPLLVDDTNLASFDDRALVLTRLPEAHRTEAEPLLNQLAAVVAEARARCGVRNHPPDSTPPADDDPRAPEFSDDALALEFSDLHGGELRYTAAWARWNRWDGAHWRTDTTLHVFNLARAVCRGAAARCDDPKAAAVLASAKTVAAVERLAKADRAHAATTDQWDRDLWVLNTPGGVVDLRTGSTRPAEPEDYCTKQTAVGPGGGCPRWRAFLERVTGGDTALEGYLRRLAGYALTGSIREHALAFLYGTGGNGKGVFLNTVAKILDGYAVTSPIDTFTASHNDRHPTELAMLQGARLVTSQETEEGRRWAESRIKTLTGGDPISARWMRGDFFTFQPTFKLIIAGNHKPGLRSVDEAIRRRFHLVPFTETIAAHERDPDLPDKLRAEWPGILGWMIEGCLEWQEGDGLRPPARVLNATAEYFAAEDAHQAWIDECCIVRPTHFESTAMLFASWKAWAERAGEQAGTQRRFSDVLAGKGFQRAKSPSGSVRGFEGISINPDTIHAYRAA